MKAPSSKAIRSLVLFMGGLAGIVYETVHEHVDRPVLLVVFVSMMGLPLFLGGDDKSARLRKAIEAFTDDNGDTDEKA